MNARSLSTLSMLLLIACGAQNAPGAASGASPATSAVTAADAPVLLYFGHDEVASGQLKSADGRLPRAGGTATLRVFAHEVARFVEGDYCYALKAHLYVRYTDDDAFVELSGLPTAYYNELGPEVVWQGEQADITLSLPANADRVEAYMYFDRISYNGCYLAYDQTDCPNMFYIAGDYVSNYGKNYALAVQR